MTNEQKTMILEVREVQKKACTEWECMFMDTLHGRLKYDQDLSHRQVMVLKKIYKKVCDSPH